MDRREFTQSIVSNLKEKISEFKNRKKQEQSERKNELDFEINKDLINKFKKHRSGNSNIDINEKINEEKKNLGIISNLTPNTNLDLNSKGIKNNNYNEIIPPQTIKSQSNNNLNYNLNMKNILENKGNLQSLINNITNPQPEKENINNNNDLNFNFIHKSRTDNNYIPSLTNENKTNKQNEINSYQRNKFKSSLNSKREYNKNNNENNERINIKKERIMNDLFKDNERKTTKRAVSPNIFSVKNYYFSNDFSNDKFKNLASKYEEDRKSKDFNISKNYLNNNTKSKYEFTTKFSSKNTNNFLNNDNDNLDNFADFTIRKSVNQVQKNKNFGNNNLNVLNFDYPTSKNTFNDKKNNSSLVSINENDIRALSSKIRFLTKEEIKNMNRSLIDELISLSNSIRRVFQDS